MIYSAKYETHNGLKKWCVLQIDNANPHLNHWNNSVKRWNVNGKGYHRSEYKIWFDPRVSVGGRVYQVRPKDVLTVVIENVRGKINEAR
jgi:hypothetical protein